MPEKALLGAGANTNHRLIRCRRCCCHWLRLRRPTHSRGSTAGAPAREKVTSRVRGAAGLAPPATRSRRAPRGAPALATRPSPAGAHGGPEPAAGRAHASRRAHSMVRCGRGGCGRPGGAHGRRAFSPPPRSAALQVRRQVGAAAAHIGPGAPGPPLLRPPARPPFCRRRPAELPPAAPRGDGGSRAGAGARLRAQMAGGLCPCLPARLPASLCVCLCLCERLRLPGKAAPAGSPSALEPSARLSTAR